jgi:hypothetical protein
MACDPQQNHALSLSLIQISTVKNTIWFAALLLSSLLSFVATGCKKDNGIPEHPKTPEEAILTLRQSLATAPKEVQDIMYNEVDTGIRYGKTQDAIAGLEKIAANPSLNEKQKKLATDVINMLKAKAGTQ